MPSLSYCLRKQCSLLWCNHTPDYVTFGTSTKSHFDGSFRKVGHLSDCFFLVSRIGVVRSGICWSTLFHTHHDTLVTPNKPCTSARCRHAGRLMRALISQQVFFSVFFFFAMLYECTLTLCYQRLYRHRILIISCICHHSLGHLATVTRCALVKKHCLTFVYKCDQSG